MNRLARILQRAKQDENRSGPFRMLPLLICPEWVSGPRFLPRPIKRLSCPADFFPPSSSRVPTVEDGNFTHEGPLERPHQELVFPLAPPSDG